MMGTALAEWCRHHFKFVRILLLVCSHALYTAPPATPCLSNAGGLGGGLRGEERAFGDYKGWGKEVLQGKQRSALA